MLVFFASIVGFSLTMGLFLQIGLGFTPLHASLLLAAMAAGAFIGSGVGAWPETAVGRPILHIGLTIMAIGTLVLYLSLHAVRHTVGTLSLIPGLAVFGIGMGMIFVPLFSIIMGEIGDHEVGSASGLLESSQQLGASLGVAVLATLFFSTISLEKGGRQAAIAAGRGLPAADHPAGDPHHDRGCVRRRVAAATPGPRNALKQQQARVPGAAAPGTRRSDLRVTWRQVMDSNHRRLSRRFCESRRCRG